ncbi:MAG: serine hydrolase [Lacrimispora sp.]|jgi:CubicO group peptidase (beta-lactamase class C family)|nr:serine hydrolase [Lacrimispora sp.]
MRLEKATPESQGVHSQTILDFLNKVNEKGFELHSFMLLKNGKKIADCWWKPYASQYRHQLFSLSKSFTSMAIGLAVEEGLLTTDTRIADIFKAEMEELGEKVDEKMKKMTVRNLLTMGTGMTYENWNWDEDNSNHILGFLSAHVKNEPGSAFFYNTMATYMCSAIITRLTGQKLVDYLMPRLFEPLGIDPVWNEDNLGISFGGFGLNIKTEDIAVFGQMLLQKGNFNGQQLVPAAWIEEATSKQINNGDEADNDWAQGYGYQFWRCVPEGVYRGDGMFGQYCIVIPEHNCVVAVTSNVDMGNFMKLIWGELLPALGGEAALPESDDYNKLIEFGVGQTHLKVSENADPYPVFRATYQLSSDVAVEKEYNIKKIRFDFENGECLLALYNGENPQPLYVIRFMEKKWVETVKPFWEAESFYRAVCYGEWKQEEFKACIWHYETPLNTKLTFTFAEERKNLVLKVMTEKEITLNYVKL